LGRTHTEVLEVMIGRGDRITARVGEKCWVMDIERGKRCGRKR